MADMDNFTWWSGSFSPLPSWPEWSGGYDQVLRDARSQSPSLLPSLQPLDGLVVEAMYPGGKMQVSRLGCTVTDNEIGPLTDV